ncbi:hypothetical protein BHU72_09415 [Desulfuribacillus stibiiarsenatis]|uniref:Peptidase U32 collagenase domain-containing protein n=1 Tax=Desulfuribacillus stibiiarsenatis TaxID=1390249 RepID=A0A1E5L2W8_9FIRM|nr:U32 family peptidase [Desulfuribacillus stibiiarsenatis]OEH84426.1 hypothetical protein BHU72_09415 [Desulfuribacillus stibiiarsenatis]
MKKIELLAPAGSLDILRTAVHAGADAIYVGGPAFSARAGAKNFTLEELKEGIDYAHFFQRKVFVAVNTIIKDSEMKELVTYAEQLAAIGPDAVILQDLGAANIFKTYIPDLSIHASTQLTTTNQYGVQALRNLGFKRVVLARELTLEEIAEIHQIHPDIEIESFIHGAQCFCYSGQCLMSSVIGGRSGNRGTCAQPCRLPYELEQMQGTLISPKDLNGIELVTSAIQSGIHTLKIEGRLKNREYVFYTVKAYRNMIDSVWNHIQSDNRDMIVASEVADVSRMAQTFNRDFSTGFLEKNLGRDWISLSRHNNKGLSIGHVEKVDPRGHSVWVRLQAPLLVGDGIYIEHPKQRTNETHHKHSKEIDNRYSKKSSGKESNHEEEEGFGFSVTEILINNKKRENAQAGEVVQLPVKHKVQVGSHVYKSFDKTLSREIDELDHPTEIGISFHLIGKVGEHAVLQYCDNDGNQGEIRTDFVVPIAQKHPISYEVVEKQLNRLGNTVFTLKAITLDIDENAMIPASILNDLRRMAVDECTSLRKGKGSFQFHNDLGIDTQEQKSLQENYKRHPMLIAKIADVNVVDYLPEEYSSIFFAGDWSSLEKIIAKKANRSIYAVIPSMVKQQSLEAIEQLVRKAVEQGVDGFVVQQIGQRELVLQVNQKADIIFDSGLHAFNQQSYSVLDVLAPKGIALSLELNQYQLKKFQYKGLIYIHSRYRLMISEHSLISENITEDKIGKSLKRNYFLKDRKGFQMPVKENRFGQIEIYNAQITSLLSEFEELLNNRHQGIIVDISHDLQNLDTLQDTLAVYAEAYKEYVETKKIKTEYRLSAPYQGELTKGHWQRGVK